MTVRGKQQPGGRGRWLVIGALAGGAIGGAGTAEAQGRLSVDTSLSGGVATNPYQRAGPSSAAASATVTVTPTYTVATALTTLSVVGNAQLTEYSDGDYPANDSYSLSGSGEHQLSNTVRLSAGVSYVNSIAGSFNDLTSPVAVPVAIPGAAAGAVGPVVQLPVLVDDPVLAAIGQRRSTFSALGGASVRLSQFDEFAARASSAASRYAGDVVLDEFNNAGAGVSYRRTLSDRMTVGINADVSRVDYLGARVGDSSIYQPSLSMTRVIDSRWTLTASVGAAVVRIRRLDGTRSSTDFNGALGACRRDTRWSACLTASRATQPSSIQGVRTRTGVSGNLTYQVSEGDSLSLTGGYSRADAPLLRAVDLAGTAGQGAGPAGTLAGAAEFFNVGASYARRIAPQLSAFTTAGASKSNDDFVNRGANIEARLGIRYRLGGRG